MCTRVLCGRCLSWGRLGASQHGDTQITERKLGQRERFLWHPKVTSCTILWKEKKRIISWGCAMDSLERDRPKKISSPGSPGHCCLRKVPLILGYVSRRRIQEWGVTNIKSTEEAGCLDSHPSSQNSLLNDWGCHFITYCNESDSGGIYLLRVL